jgi:hypothetical protein
MIRTLSLLLGCAVLAVSQIQPPLIGHIRDRAGRVVPVYGVAGTFSLGEPLTEGATEASFIGGSGFLRTVDGWFRLENGNLTRVDDAAGGLSNTADNVWLESQTAGNCRQLLSEDHNRTKPCPDYRLTLADFTQRLQLPEEVAGFERMAADWYVLRGERGLYAVRWRQGSEPEVCQLPEAEPEPAEAIQ